MEVLSLQDLNIQLEATLIKLRNELSLGTIVVSIRKRARASIKCVYGANFNNGFYIHTSFRMRRMCFHHTSRSEVSIGNFFAYSFAIDEGKRMLVLFSLRYS